MNEQLLGIGHCLHYSVRATLFYFPYHVILKATVSNVRESSKLPPDPLIKSPPQWLGCLSLWRLPTG